MNEIMNDIMKDIVNDKKGHNIVNDIKQLCISQTVIVGIIWVQTELWLQVFIYCVS